MTVYVFDLTLKGINFIVGFSVDQIPSHDLSIERPTCNSANLPTSLSHAGYTVCMVLKSVQKRLSKNLLNPSSI